MSLENSLLMIVILLGMILIWIVGIAFQISFANSRLIKIENGRNE